MTNPFTDPPAPPPGHRLRVGQAVHVNAHASWLAATVTFVTATRVGVTCPTSAPPGPAAPLVAAVAPWVVRPADGVRLLPVRHLRSGDELVAFDGTAHTITAVARHRTGWWVITYATGDQAAVPPTAVLRLTDPTPTVTVHGTRP